MMKRIIVVSFLLYLSFSVVGQANLNVDSLMQLTQSDISAKEKINIYLKLADFYSSSDSIKTAEVANKAIALSKQINYPQGSIDGLFEIGWVTMRYGHNEKATELYRQVIEEAKQIGYQKKQAQGWNGLGIIAWRIGKFDDAIDHYTKALNLLQEINDLRGVAGSYNNIAVIYKERGLYAMAIDYYFQSLRIKGEIGDERGSASTYNNLGVVFRLQGDTEKALEYYRKALDIHEKLDYKKGIAEVSNNIGIIYQIQEEFDIALDYFNESLHVKEVIGDRMGTATTFNNIGLIYKSQKNYEKALEFHNRSIAISEEVGSVTLMSVPIMSKGEIYFQSGRTKLAKQYYQQGLDLAKEIGNLSTYSEAVEGLSKVEEAIGNYQSALELQMLFKQLSDSLFNKETNRKITLIAAEYNFQQERDSIRVYNEAKQFALVKEIESQRMLLITLSLIIILITWLVVNRIRYSKKSRKTIETLTALNLQITEQKEQLITQADQLKQANEEVKLLNDSLESRISKRTAKVKEQHQKLIEYAFNNSHRMRAPLANLLGFVDLLKSGNQDEKDDIADHIYESAKKLDDVIKENSTLLSLKEKE